MASKDSISRRELITRLVRRKLANQSSEFQIPRRQVPNSRVIPEVNALKELGEETKHKTVKIIRAQLEEVRAEAINPEEFWSLSETLLYRVDILGHSAEVL